MTAESQFIKLNDNNWNVWKFQVKVVLLAKELYDITTGICQKPTNADIAALQKYLVKDARAQEILVTRMEPGPLSHVLTCNTANEMWQKLHTIYERHSSVSIHLLQQQFFNLKFEDNVMNFLSKIQNITTAVKQQNEEIPEKMVTTKIIMSLPERYKHFVSAWESVMEDQRTLSNLTARLLVEEERVKSSEEVVALTAKKQCQIGIKCFLCGKIGHKKNQCRNLSGNRNLVCHFCNKKGHVLKDCWFRNRKIPKKNGEHSGDSLAFIGTELEAELDTEWYLDSGASEHMCFDYEQFGHYVKLNESKQVKIGDGSLITAEGTGTIFIKSYNGENFVSMEIRNVLHVPDLKVNLFSQGKALDKGFYMVSDANGAKFIHQESGKVYALAKRKKKLFRMMFQMDKDKMADRNFQDPVKQSECCVAKSGRQKLEEKTLLWWHEALAHQHFNYVKKLLTQNKIRFEDTNTPFCEACIKGKQHRSSFLKSKSKSVETCNIIHADICGPMEVTSIGGSRFMLLFKDDYSHYRQVYFLKHKDEVFDKFVHFIMFCKTQMNKSIRVLRTDNGREFVNHRMRELMIKHGIEHQTSVPYCPEQNGRAEREMRTIIEAARAMMVARDLDKKFWAEAANTAVYIINRSGTSTVTGKTPYQLWTNRDFDLRNFGSSFGMEVWVHIPKEKRQKLDVKSEKGIFVGYGESTKGFRIYFPKKCSVTLERDVIFVPENYAVQGDESITKSSTGVVYPEISITREDQGETGDEELGQNGHVADKSTDDSQSVGIELRPRAELQRPSRYDDFETSFVTFTDVEEPSCYEEAINSSLSKQWQKSMQTELKCLADNDTWTIVNEPLDCDIIDSKWVYKIKRDSEGKITHFKSRLVARGFQQKGLVYEDVYSPVAKLNTFRTLLAISVNFDWSIFQMDVCSAFLHGEINENVFMNLPQNCNLPTGKVCKLKKSIYGLKKAPKCWYEKFDKFMMLQDFIRSENDHCLYFKISVSSKIYVLIYVDDLIIVGSDIEKVNDLKTEMKCNFKMKDMGYISYYLGISICQDINGSNLTLCQANYLENVLKRFNMFECKSVSTPMDNNFDYNSLLREKSESPEMENKCRKLIGCIMYAMLGSRPDLCNCISILSRYQKCASNDLFLCLKRVLRYIKGTIALKLVYKKHLSSDLIKGYVDADWGGDTISRRSTSGYCFKIFECTVSWNSKKQSSVALSSTEAEYIALSQCVSEACWFRNLLIELQVTSEVKNQSVLLFEDNQSAIRISKSCEQPKRLKHINVKYHFVKEKVKEGIVQIVYLPTSEQIGDIFTKPLGKVLFERFRDLILGLG